jgi:hypothetical protein
MKNEIILFQPNEISERIEVRIDEENETFWLTQEQIAELFERDRTVITKHFKNIFRDQELDEKMVSAFFAHTTQHGAVKGKTQEKLVKHYNLDAILSVGYRVNSKRGTQFRIWANRVLKDYIVKGYAVNNRMNRLEDNIETLKDKVQYIDLQIQSKLIPKIFIPQGLRTIDDKGKENAISKMMITILGTVAEMERSRIRENQ